MNKIRRPYDYIDTVREHDSFFKSYYYHSVIDLNLVKLDSILQHGILCKAEIEEKQLPGIYTHSARDFDSKNGNTFVSLAEYSDETAFLEMFESFTVHTLSCVSLLVDKRVSVVSEGERETFFDDEVFCYQGVPKNAILGIILPEHLVNLKISQVCCLTSDIDNYRKRYVEHWILEMEKYFGEKIDQEFLLSKVIELGTIFEEVSRPERWVSSCLENQRKKFGCDLIDALAMELERLWLRRIGVDTLKYIEAIDYINRESLPVYEIGKKSLKRIR